MRVLGPELGSSGDVRPPTPRPGIPDPFTLTDASLDAVDSEP